MLRTSPNLIFLFISFSLRLFSQIRKSCQPELYDPLGPGLEERPDSPEPRTAFAWETLETPAQSIILKFWPILIYISLHFASKMTNKINLVHFVYSEWPKSWRKHLKQKVVFSRPYSRIYKSGQFKTTCSDSM